MVLFVCLQLQQSLHTAELSVSSLQQHIHSLSGSDTIRRIREEYEMNIATLKEHHVEEVLKLKNELEGKQNLELEKTEPPNKVKDTSPMSSFLSDGSHLGTDNKYRNIMAENEDLRCLISNLEEERDHAHSDLIELRDRLISQESLVAHLEGEKGSLLTQLEGLEENSESLTTKLNAIEGVLKTERERYLQERIRFEEYVCMYVCTLCMYCMYVYVYACMYVYM